MEYFLIATILLIVLIFAGVPIAFAIGATTTIYLLLVNPANLISIPSRMFSGINSFTLMALPLFMLAAEIMVRTGISTRLFDFVRISWIGKLRGGLAYVNILASTIFGSISGAALSDIAGLGYVEMKAMEEDGYDKGFAAAVTAASSCESPLIPPSNVAILYAGTMSLSVGAVLWAGLIPGLLLAAAQMLYVALNAKRMNLPKHEKHYTKEEKRVIRKEGCLALGMPLIILLGITLGWFTPTESAAVAVVYAIVVGVLIFHNISVRDFMSALWVSAKTTANLFLITSFSAVFAWAIGNEQVPQKIAEAILEVADSKYVVLLIMNLILIIAGMWLETSAAVLLFAPILAPIVVAAGVNPIHFAVICIVNLTLGLITPPVGVVLYATAGVADISFGRMVKAALPFIIINFIVLALITYIPAICLAVPQLLGFTV
ncbi:MAG: TRAP transporter large permease [Lachnospiraceae bacterium]|jgi:tripartite ATP-independent transporter DctM subunit|nr:TRAP transporter large permease [Lachnospiraceae bacterium]